MVVSFFLGVSPTFCGAVQVPPAVTPIREAGGSAVYAASALLCSSTADPASGSASTVECSTSLHARYPVSVLATKQFGFTAALGGM